MGPTFFNDGQKKITLDTLCCYYVYSFVLSFISLFFQEFIDKVRPFVKVLNNTGYRVVLDDHNGTYDLLLCYRDFFDPLSTGNAEPWTSNIEVSTHKRMLEISSFHAKMYAIHF